MGNLRKSLLEMHFKDQISKIITLNGKSNENWPLLSQN